MMYCVAHTVVFVAGIGQGARFIFGLRMDKDIVVDDQ